MGEDSRDFGRGGCQVLSGASQGLASDANPYFCLSVLSDCVITSLTIKTDFDFFNKEGLLNTTLLAGTHIYGRFSEITISSGIVLCYLEKRDE